MTPAADALADFERTEFTAEGKTRDVYRIGSGPGVIVISEMPGITPGWPSSPASWRAMGFTAVLPHLFGEPGRAVSVPYVLNSHLLAGCISREFSTMALRRTSPVTIGCGRWPSVHAELRRPRRRCRRHVLHRRFRAGDDGGRHGDGPRAQPAVASVRLSAGHQSRPRHLRRRPGAGEGAVRPSAARAAMARVRARRSASPATGWFPARGSNDCATSWATVS